MLSKKWKKGRREEGVEDSAPAAAACRVNMKKFLIIGLGNVGDSYRNTRHNIISKDDALA